MFKLKFGKPKGTKEAILALLGGDTSLIKDSLYTLGFKFNPLNNYWVTSKFNSHTIDYLKEIDPDIEISDFVREKYQHCLLKPEPIFKNTLRQEMMLPHQWEALNFLQKAGSGILAYQIGTGKTLGSLSYAEYMGINTLIVCPAKLRKQWEEEIKKFTNSVGFKIAGTQSERKELWQYSKDYHYAIISYESFLNEKDIEYIKNYSNNGMIIFDEITKLKNSKSKTFKAAFEVRQQARFAVGLTGTPYENNLGDIYALLRLITPYYIPKYEIFAQNFLKQSEHEVFNPNTGHKIRYNRIDGEKNIEQFKKILKPVMIRKTREEVLDLPSESTITYDIELTKEQREIEDILKSLAKMYSEYILKWFIFAMENLISPSLVNVSSIGEVAPFEAYEVQSRSEGSPMTPRLETISEILEEIDGQKVIIFSKYVRALDLIQKEILYKHGYDYKEVSGRVKHPEEELLSFKTNANTNVLCMTQAGQYGLNITEAPLLIIVDKPLNPAKLDQLKGRIYRKGQKVPVTYFELISNSPTEQRIESIISKKQVISQKVLAREVLL
jgi:SNF2 family DNA or RNA helicase